MNGARLPRTRFVAPGPVAAFFVGLFACGLAFYVLLLVTFAALNSF